MPRGWDKVRLERQAELLHAPRPAWQSWEVLPTHSQLPGTPTHVTRGTSSAKQLFPASLASPALCGTWCHRWLPPPQVLLGRSMATSGVAKRVAFASGLAMPASGRICLLGLKRRGLCSQKLGLISDEQRNGGSREDRYKGAAGVKQPWEVWLY